MEQKEFTKKFKDTVDWLNKMFNILNEQNQNADTWVFSNRQVSINQNTFDKLYDYYYSRTLFKVEDNLNRYLRQKSYEFIKMNKIDGFAFGEIKVEIDNSLPDMEFKIIEI